MTPDQREIVLISVPFTDLSSAKKRPVVVLSKTGFNRRSPDVVVAAITSNLASGSGGIPITSTELDRGALPVPSLVRADKIYTLSKTLIVKKYGRLNPAAFAQVLTAIDEIIGI